MLQCEILREINCAPARYGLGNRRSAQKYLKFLYRCSHKGNLLFLERPVCNMTASNDRV